MPGPTPPYNNVPIQPQNFMPRSYEIDNITLGRTTIVETLNEMDYVIGQLVRLLIPNTWGCRQLNEKTGMVIDIPSNTQVILDIDSSQNVDPFNSSGVVNIPQIVPVGDYNSGAINFSRTNNVTFIEGSFINISPA